MRVSLTVQNAIVSCLCGQLNAAIPNLQTDTIVQVENGCDFFTIHFAQRQNSVLVYFIYCTYSCIDFHTNVWCYVIWMGQSIYIYKSYPYALY